MRAWKTSAAVRALIPCLLVVIVLMIVGLGFYADRLYQVEKAYVGLRRMYDGDSKESLFTIKRGWRSGHYSRGLTGYDNAPDFGRCGCCCSSTHTQ